MKKILLPILIITAVGFSACNSKKDDINREMVLLNDSLNRSNAMSDTAAFMEAPVVEAPVANHTHPQKSVSRPRAKTTVSNRTEPSPTNTSSTSNGTTQTEAQKKEGMSKAAQGAIIGGVGGAVVGAVVTKKAKGAVIGGVVGAAGGYIIGRKKDKNDGRVGN